MKNEIIKIDSPELQVLEKSKAQKIKETFDPMVKMLEGFDNDYNSIIQESSKEITQELTEKAKRLRLDISKVRTKTENVRKEQKEEYLRAGKAIDGVSNILKWAVSDKENKLKEIENYFEIQEQKRLEKLQSDRVEKISPYLPDANERDLSGMEEDVWESYFSAKKKAFEDEQAAIKKAEEERKEQERLNKLRLERETMLRPYWNFVPKEHPSFESLSVDEWDDFFNEMQSAKEAYDVQQEHVRKENERLKKEADEKAEKERKEKKARAEKQRKEKEAQEAKLKAEREEKERVQAELRKREEAERLAKEEEERKRQEELAKGDSQKVQDLIKDLTDLKTKYSFESDFNKKMYKKTCVILDEIIFNVNKKP